MDSNDSRDTSPESIEPLKETVQRYEERITHFIGDMIVQRRILYSMIVQMGVDKPPAQRQAFEQQILKEAQSIRISEADRLRCKEPLDPILEALWDGEESGIECLEFFLSLSDKDRQALLLNSLHNKQPLSDQPPVDQPPTSTPWYTWLKTMWYKKG